MCRQHRCYCPQSTTDIAGTPGRVKVVDGDEFTLHICPGSAFLGGTEQDTDSALVHSGEKLFLLHIGVGVMYESYLIFGNTGRYQFCPHIIVHTETSIAFWSRQVAKNYLCQAVGFALIPDAEHVVGTGVDFTAGAVREHGVDYPLVEGQFAPVVCDFEFR